MSFAQWYTVGISVFAMAIFILIIALSIQRKLQEKKDKKKDEWDKAHDPSKIGYSRSD